MEWCKEYLRKTIPDALATVKGEEDAFRLIGELLAMLESECGERPSLRVGTVIFVQHMLLLASTRK